MIIKTGHMEPTPAQRRMLRECSDDSFTQQVPENFGCVPTFDDGWEIDRSSMVGLHMKCVEPHIDDWVGEGNIPRRYVAVFWVFIAPRWGDLILQVGAKAHRMSDGDYVIFKDSVMHSVYSKRFWHGCAYQMRYVNKVRKQR